MTSSPLERAPRFRSRRRTAKPDTHRQLLETAGEVFAEKGLDGATGLEICQRAGVNTAAINYYFGGMDGLYEAVLIEARGRLPSLAMVSAAVAQNPNAHSRLRAVIDLVVGVLTGPTPNAWTLRLLMRELISPSPMFESLVFEAEGLPKLRLFKSVVAEILDLPEDHPAVAQSGISVFAPFMLLMLGQDSMRKRAFPELDLSPSGATVMAERMYAFALGGLSVIREREKAERPPG